MSKLLIEDNVFESVDYRINRLEAGEYESCRFVNCVFANGDLSGIKFWECEFDNCDLSMANLSKTSFQQVCFETVIW